MSAAKSFPIPWLLGLGFVVASGCDSDTGSTTAAVSELRRSNQAEPDTLDPHRSEETAAFHVLRDLYEGLTSENRDSSLAPGAAASWTVSEDGTVYTFHLQPEGKWSNGDTVTAADFVASMRRALDPATRSTTAQLLLPISNAGSILAGGKAVTDIGVRAIDERTLEIELEAPTPYFLSLLSHPVTYPVHASTHNAAQTDPAADGLVSNGAYSLESWRVESHIVLARNPHYWQADEVAIDTVRFIPIEDKSAELQRYRAGELDITDNVPNARFDWIRVNLGDEFKTAPLLNTYFYILDTSEPPLDDPLVREALTMTVDRQLVVGDVMGGGGEVALGLVPPGVQNYSPQRYEWASRSAEDRIRRARELYANAGYGPDKPLQLEILYNTSDNHKRIAIALQNMWSTALGAKVSVLNQEWKVLLQTRNDPGRWDVIRYGWSGDYNDANTFLEIFRSDSDQNPTGFANPDYDALIDGAAVATDAGARRELLQRAEALLLEANPFIVIYFYLSKRLVKPYVRGYEANIMNRVYSRHLSFDASRR